MSEPTQPVTDAIAYLHVGVVRKMAVICRQLIEARVLNRDLLVSSLIEAQSVLRKEGMGPIGVSVPAGLVAALGQSAERQP